MASGSSALGVFGFVFPLNASLNLCMGLGVAGGGLIATGISGGGTGAAGRRKNLSLQVGAAGCSLAGLNGGGMSGAVGVPAEGACAGRPCGGMFIQGGGSVIQGGGLTIQ